jgi:hypothetical protein
VNRRAMHVIVSVLLIFSLQMQCEIWCVTESVTTPTTTPPCHEEAPSDSDHGDECDHPQAVDDASLITISKSVASTGQLAMNSFAARLLGETSRLALGGPMIESVPISHPAFRILILRI